FSLLGVTKLPFTVCCEQQYLGLGGLRQVPLLLFVLCEQLRVLAGLILQTAQTSLRDRAEFSGFGKSPTFPQQSFRSIRHRFVDFALVSLHKVEPDHATTHSRLRF